MSIIYKKKTIVDSGIKMIDLTLAEYNALSDSEKNNGVYYNITDDEDPINFVSTVSQSFTTAQKEQACTNIDAVMRSLFKNESYQGVTITEFLANLTVGTSSPFQHGSVYISTTSGVITYGWYTYLYIPHRNGMNGDNYKYGTLLMFNMISSVGKVYMYGKVNGGWQGPFTIR